MKKLNEFLNEGGFKSPNFEEWSKTRFLKIENGKDTFEFSGDPKIKGYQAYSITKNGKSIGSFYWDNDDEFFWITLDKVKGDLSGDNIDEVINVVKKNS